MRVGMGRAKSAARSASPFAANWLMSESDTSITIWRSLCGWICWKQSAITLRKRACSAPSEYSALGRRPSMAIAPAASGVSGSRACQALGCLLQTPPTLVSTSKAAR